MPSEHSAKDNGYLSNLPPDSVLFGKSVLMRELEVKVKRVLGTNLPVLLQGENGTGKGLFAKLIHSRSDNVLGPYVRVSCAGLPSTLVEIAGEDNVSSDAFSMRAAFSSTGTLYLDEVGELSYQGQARLLHSLFERQDTGSSGQSNGGVRARIISSTTHNLRQEVNEKKFRRDLFYRLAVVTLEVPALRSRLDDLLIIANYLRQRYCENFGFPDRPFPKKLIERMHYYTWPGNLRELENFVCRYVVFGPDERVLIFNRGSAAVPGIATPGETLIGETLLKDATKRALADVEREMIVKALELHNGDLKRAASILGVSYRTLMNKMDLAGLPRTRHAVKSRRDRKS